MATKGIWVSAEIMHDTNLTVSEKFILAEIGQLSSLDEGCFAQNKHFAELIGSTTRTVTRAITDLQEKGYIRVDVQPGTRNHVREMSTLDKMSNPPRQNVETPPTKCLETKGNKQINKQINKQVVVITPEMKVSEYLLKKILEFKPNFRKPNLNLWAKDIELAMRVDGRTQQELIGCVNWIHSKDGEWWIPNVLSGKKLRKNFDTMESQMVKKSKSNDIDFSWMDELEAENAS